MEVESGRVMSEAECVEVESRRVMSEAGHGGGKRARDE